MASASRESAFGVAYALVALLMFALIITIPFGIASARIALFCVWPFGRTLVRRPDAGAGSLIRSRRLARVAAWLSVLAWRCLDVRGSRLRAPAGRRAFTLTLAAPAVASAKGRAFTVLGTDSKFRALPSRGWPLATDLSRNVAALTALPDGRIAILGVAGTVAVIDMRGHLVDIARLPSPFGGDPELPGYDLEYLADGSLLAVCGGRVHRVELSGRHQEVATGDARDARGLQPLPDGSFLLAARNRVVHILTDGTVRPIAGSGRAGRPREGGATAVPAGHPLDVLQLPDGSVAFTEDASRTVWIVRDGVLRHLAGGGRDFREIPRRGRPARSVSLLFSTGGELLWLGGTRGLAFMSDDGLLAVRSGRIRPIVRGSWDTPRGAAPLWAASRVREGWLYGPGGVDRTSSDELVLGGAHGVVLHTRSDQSDRLAAAIATSSQRTVWQRNVEVTLTRPAHVRVRARSDDRTVGQVSADLQPGRSRVRLPRRLPRGVTRLELRAVTADGAIATHRLNVLGRPRLPLAVARRALISESDTAGDVVSIARRWRRLGPRRLRCRLTVGSEGEIFSRTRPTISLAGSGWITVRDNGPTYRLEVL